MAVYSTQKAHQVTFMVNLGYICM